MRRQTAALTSWHQAASFGYDAIAFVEALSAENQRVMIDDPRQKIRRVPAFLGFQRIECLNDEIRIGEAIHLLVRHKAPRAPARPF
jgi:hypothetical protein